MIIERIMTRTRAHDFRTESNWIDMGPFALNPFAISSAHPTTKIQRPYALTLFSVPEDVKFGDDGGEKDIAKVELHGKRKVDETSGKTLWTVAYDVPYPNWAFAPAPGMGPTATPIVSGGKVYMIGAIARLTCDRRLGRPPRRGFGCEV